MTPVLVLIIAYLSLKPFDPTSKSDNPLWRAVQEVLEIAAELVLKSPEQSDKVAHFLAYTALAAAGIFGFGRVMVLALSAIAYGLLMEFLQGLGGTRTASFFDVLANSLGVAFGIGIALIALRLLKGPEL